MIWLAIFVCILLVLLLSALEGFWFSPAMVGFLGNDGVIYIQTVLLLGLALAWLLLKRRAWSSLPLLKIGFFVLFLGLFAWRAIGAYVQYEQKALDKRYLVWADVHIEQVQDGLYDEILGTSYRQVARLTNVHQATDGLAYHAFVTNNPFGEEFHQEEKTDWSDLKLPQLDGMTVLIQASPNFGIKPDNFKSQVEQLQVGTLARMQLVLTPIANKPGSDFDIERWLRTQQVHATASLLQIDQVKTKQNLDLVTRLQKMRQDFQKHFHQDWHQLSLDEQQAKAVTLSLLTGDRALIDKSTKQLYQLAGILHLLAISGSHVLFLAVILSGFVTACLNRLAPMCYQKISRWQISMVLMVLASMMYALFTGFDVPAVRTVYMLFALMLARWLVLPLTSISILSWVALVMIWLDPYVLWQAGFWLSFVAVLLLMRYEVDESQAISLIDESKKDSILISLVNLVKLQFWLFFAMLPLSVFLFGKVSLWGLLVNLFAIGFFGFFIVPINLLAGSLYGISTAVSDFLWGISSYCLRLFHQALDFGLSDQVVGVSAWLYAPFGIFGFILCFFLILLWLMPPVLPKSLMALPALLLGFLIWQPVQDRGLDVYVLETGKAVHQTLLVHQHQGQKTVWLVLSDMGAKKLDDGHADTLISVIKRHGVSRLDGVIVQTPSSIFVDVLHQLGQQIPINQYWQAGRPINQQGKIYQSCEAGSLWQTQGLTIRALTGWPKIDDDQVWSCELEVISDRAGRLSTELQPVLDNQLTDHKGSTHLILSAAQDPMIWQMWSLMCKGDYNKHLQFNHQDGSQRLWLTSPKGVLLDEVMGGFNPDAIYYLPLNHGKSLD